MLELSQHILDIAENSILAGAKLITISVTEDSTVNLLTIEISDDGCGIEAEAISRVLDPFYTTKNVRRIGLGLPLLADAAKTSGGKLDLQSQRGQGTKVTATFQLNHIDRQPLGNMSLTLITLIAANLDIDFIYNHRHNDRQFCLDTREVRNIIDNVPINHPEIIKYLRGVIEKGFREIETEA